MNTDTDTSRRPSLYSCSGSSSEKAEAFSLLDAGERSRTGILRGHRLAFLLLALTLLAMGMALVRLGAPRIPSWAREAASARHLAAPPSVSPAVAPQVTANDPASAVPLAGAASIVSEAEPVVDAAEPAPTFPPVAAGEAGPPASTLPDTASTGTASTLAALAASPATAAEKMQTAKLAPPATPSKKAAASVRHASGAKTSAARHASHHTIHAYRKPGHGKRSRKEDSDVDLIAALLSRVSHGDKTEASPTKRTTSKAASTPAKGKVDDQNRDIVMPGQNESLAHLVQRCRALGVVEGELCRIRICSGKWGKDPACPTSLGAPSS